MSPECSPMKLTIYTLNRSLNTLLTICFYWLPQTGLPVDRCEPSSIKRVQGKRPAAIPGGTVAPLNPVAVAVIPGGQ